MKPKGRTFHVKILGYGLSQDRVGLLAFIPIRNKRIDYFHIHSDEMTIEQKKLHKILLKMG
jgi:hypothetical protein